MLLLSREDVERLYTMEDAFAAVTDAAIAWVAGEAEAPPRTALHAAGSGIETLVMPGAVSGRYTGAKIWYAGPGTDELPVSSAVIVILDPELGEVLLDGSVITDLRTGAMTGLAARWLAPEGASVVTILGAGIQARAQALALAHALPGLTEIRISSRRAEAREGFVARLTAELATGHPGVRVVSCGDAEGACRGSQVIVAATTSRTPVVWDGWVEGDALVCGVGSHDPGAAEIDPAIVRRASSVVVDTKRGGIDGAGDIAQVIDAGDLDRGRVIELGELLAEPQRVAPRVDGAPRVLKTVGFAAADLVSARRVAAAAAAVGAGRRVDIH